MAHRRRIYFSGETESRNMRSLAARGVDELDRSVVLIEARRLSIRCLRGRVAFARQSDGDHGCLCRRRSEKKSHAGLDGVVPSYNCAPPAASSIDDQPGGAAQRGRQRYRATLSDQSVWDRARRPKPCKPADRVALCHTMAQTLERKRSPQQIAGWLKRGHPDYEGARVSHETICKSLFIQAPGVLKKQLLAHLRATLAIRRSRTGSKELPLVQIHVADLPFNRGIL